MHPIRHVTTYNDLGHPLCGHLRDGSWAMDYIYERLEKYVLVIIQLRVPCPDIHRQATGRVSPSREACRLV